MHVVLRVGEVELDVEVHVPAGAGVVVAQLAEALAGGRVAPGTGIVVGDRLLGPEVPLAGAGIRQGDVLRLARTPPAPAPGAPVAELRLVGGTCAGARLPLPPGSVVVGRHGDAVPDHPTVSARHARLSVAGAGTFVVEDLGSTNGTRVDGVFVTAPAAVGPGHLLELGAVQARVVPAGAGPVAPLGAPGVGTGTAPFNRPPRAAPPPGPAAVAVPVLPPEPAPAARFSWAMLLAPLVLGAVMAVVFEPVMAAFAVFGPVVTVGTWWEDRRRVAREREANGRRRAADLAAFAAGLARAAEEEVDRRRLLLPDPAEVLGRAEGPDTRVWERRRTAPEFLRLRLGLADASWQAPLAEGPGTRLPEAGAALASSGVLRRVPVEVDVGPGRALGVVGPRPAAAALVRSLVCQAAVHHGPADLRIAVLADHASASGWDWAKWLPHTAGLQAAGREGAEAVAVGWRGADGGPALLAVVDGEGFTEGRCAAVRDLLAAGGVGAVVVAPSASRLPATCTAVVELEGEDGAARLHETGAASSVDRLLVAGVPEPLARACARSLARLEDPEAADAGGHLPASVPLLGLLGLDQVSAEALRRRWRASSSASSLAAVVGAAGEGPLVLDLVADGPHALVAGTTGSGKSELLRTLVASLATAYGPDQLTFVLVDYKGGSAFAGCARLPHVVGMVTDLDEHLGERALRSLEAELRHRETVLAEAGAADLCEYAAGRASGAPLAPLPRLVVVIDEFATLAAELPDFMDSLVGIAQRGRSLGVHLVLATQRPSGAVSDSIRANTNLRIALRVQDVPDSTDVLGTPAAAGLDRRVAGRGFVRLGSAEVVAFQAALVSAAGPSGAGSVVRAGPFGFATPAAAPAGPQDAGVGAWPGPGGPGASGVDDGAPTDLARLVGAARDAARAEGGRPPRRPWLEPLPSAVLLRDLPAGAVGLADEPHRQRQVPYSWAPAAGNLLLCGVAGSGTSTALASLALALVAGPGGAGSHVYVLDFGAGALAPLAALPQVGAVVVAGERERQERLVRTLRAELERRRDAVASGRPGRRPAVVLLVDSLGGLCAAFDDVPGMAVRDDLARVLADGPALGMVAVAGVDRPGAVPVALGALFPERLVFRLADPYDATAFGLAVAPGRRRPAGRAVDVTSRCEVQVALPAPGGLDELAAAVADMALSVPPPCTAPASIAVLPEVVDVAGIIGLARLDGPEWFVPVAVGDAELAPVGFRLGEGDHVLVAGPARSGKSTVLCAVARVVHAARPDAGVWAVAPRRSPLREAPGVSALVTDPAGVGPALEAVLAASGPQVVLVDDADTVDGAAGAFEALFGARRPDVHVVAAGRADALRTAYGHWVTHVRRSRQGLALRPHLDLDGDLWHTVLPRRGPARYPAGRGYLVYEGSVELVQAAAGAQRHAGSPGPVAAVPTGRGPDADAGRPGPVRPTPTGRGPGADADRPGPVTPMPAGRSPDVRTVSAGPGPVTVVPTGRSPEVRTVSAGPGR
ncbi:MAG: FtsK/SpoIIIE domain-containing protein [Actinomycetota bacterium]